MQGKKEKKEVLSMKDALSSLSDSEIKEITPQKDLRDFFWNYPSTISKIFKTTHPFSYILLFITLGFVFILFLHSATFANILDGAEDKETFTEGSVGAISSFNPIFASANYFDKSVESLVFDKFIHIDKDGKPIVGIAEKWSTTESKLEYIFTIKKDLLWQNGEKLTAQDVVFTFKTALSLSQDYNYDTVGISLEGVTVEQIDEYTVKFKLVEENPLFFEAISIYIVPYSVLGDVNLGDMPFNIFARYPIGSGKYKVTRTEQNAVYLVDNEYDRYTPNIKNITLRVYPDTKSLNTAFRTGLLDAVNGWDQEALSFTTEYPNFETYIMEEKYRSKLMFFNLRKEDLKDENLRKGLSSLIDKDKLYEEAKISGVSIYGPYPPDSWVYNKDVDYLKYSPEKAKAYLKSAGYERKEGGIYYESKENEILSFTLTYFQSESNDRLVTKLKELLELEGVILKTERLNYTQITQEIIATRDFELLLFEVETTVDPDQYNLWHSLKSSYPDLNLSGYSYERVDILLEDGRRTTNVNTRKARYVSFQKYLVEDAPVVFLYHPNFVYVVNDQLKGVNLKQGNFSYERFANIESWYWK
ncbi:MAG TPA: ABC transporter substrate-binding protein [Candidatus Dojkabacteria bacterium]|nr:ABC transporter substrate-binding protein [Candidatus Dojkabacteria bacterium]